MRAEPATCRDVGGDRRGQQAERQEEGSAEPAQLDAALEHKAVEDPENQDQDGGFCKEGGAAGGDGGEQVRDDRGLGLPGARECRGEEDEAGGRVRQLSLKQLPCY